MKTKKVLKYVSRIWGIIVTSLWVLIFGVLIGEKLFEEGSKYLIEISKNLFNWYDDPTGFFITYLIGYAIIWWKPLWGSIIIIFASTMYVIIAGFDGPPIFAIPAFSVGLFYLIYSITLTKNKIIYSAN